MTAEDSMVDLKAKEPPNNPRSLLAPNPGMLQGEVLPAAFWYYTSLLSPLATLPQPPILGPKMGQVSLDYDLKEAFNQLSYMDGWEDAELSAAVHYARGSKLLHIPDSWRPLLPDFF